MRITTEIPSQLLEQARKLACEQGISLNDFIVAAIAQCLKTRKDPPSVEGPKDMKLLSREELDEAMFG